MGNEDTLAGSAEQGDAQAQPETTEAVTAETTETEAPETEVKTDEGDAASLQGDEGEGGKQPEPDPEAEQAKKRKQQSADQRIGEITARRREAERKAADAEARAQRAEEKLKLYEADPPKEEDFESYDQYTTALAAHQLGQTTLKSERKQDADDAREDASTAKTEARRSAYDEYRARADVFAETAPDYLEVVEGPNADFSEVMAEEIFTSEKGPQIAYHLAKNPAELKRIAQLTNPTDVAREVARVEGRLTQPAPKRVTTAPDPVKAVATGSGSSGGNDPGKMSVADMQKMFKKTGVLS